MLTGPRSLPDTANQSGATGCVGKQHRTITHRRPDQGPERHQILDRRGMVRVELAGSDAQLITTDAPLLINCGRHDGPI